MFRQFVAWWWV